MRVVFSYSQLEEHSESALVSTTADQRPVPPNRRVTVQSTTETFPSRDGRPCQHWRLCIKRYERETVDLCISCAAVTITIRLRFDGRSTTYQRSLRSQ